MNIEKNIKKKRDFVPTVKEDYIPEVVNRLINKINSSMMDKIVLYGFGDNMKWLYRILRENGIDPILCDWRKKYIKYDCGGENLVSIDSIKNDDKTIVISCIDEINDLKNSINYIIENNFSELKIIFDISESNSPFNNENPYKDIAKRALNRARSMISNEQLFDLIQFISQTKSVEGDILEFGSLHGGSGAVIAEAVNHYCKEKKVFLFDTFSGIPDSKYGLDYHWKNSFSNNSYEEVKNAFSDMKNVSVIKGNIIDTHKIINNKISFLYLASDTFETGKLILNKFWKKISKGGIIAICDYGSFPNCLPLTVYVDIFIENKQNEIFVYRPERVGIFIIKK